MVEQSVQEPLSGMTKGNPLSYLTAQGKEILHEVGELTYRTVLRNRLAHGKHGRGHFCSPGG